MNDDNFFDGDLPETTDAEGNTKKVLETFNELMTAQEEFDQIKTSVKSGTRPCWETTLGGKIGIHGMGSSRDWTAGCIAMEDEDIIWLWDQTEIGDDVEIYE